MWRKKLCYVITGFYKDDDGLPDNPEEYCVTSYDEALRIKKQLEEDDDIESVNLEEDERELWVDANEAAMIDLKKMDIPSLIGVLDQLVVYSKKENIYSYEMVRKEIIRRLKNPLDDSLINS